MEEQLQDMRDRITRLETLMGDDSGEGLRGDVKSIKDTLANLQAKMMLAIGGGAALLGAIQIGIAIFSK